MKDQAGGQNRVERGIVSLQPLAQAKYRIQQANAVDSHGHQEELSICQPQHTPQRIAPCAGHKREVKCAFSSPGLFLKAFSSQSQVRRILPKRPSRGGVGQDGLPDAFTGDERRCQVHCPPTVHRQIRWGICGFPESAVGLAEVYHRFKKAADWGMRHEAGESDCVLDSAHPKEYKLVRLLKGRSVWQVAW